MTDWLPWGALLMATTLGTLWALIRDGDLATNRALARRILLFGGLATTLVYLLYIVIGETWLPY